jgi:hypothetical protein
MLLQVRPAAALTLSFAAAPIVVGAADDGIG